MFHSFIGQAGHLAVIVSFVSAGVCVYGFVSGTVCEQSQSKSWEYFSKSFFVIHVAAVLCIVGCLFTIIYNHYYEYYYAWSHSSSHLPVQYMVSCFWEGQEGSFLLWLFWHCLIGLIILLRRSEWQMPVMAVICAVQAFLASMILGVVMGDVKIGSSPFILLREYMTNAPIFQSKPEFVPADGTGLNPLLQNYWMVIHPPTLFLGFALTVVPFAYAIAGLWLKKYSEWIAPAKVWTLVGCIILGIGILMGGYWAYETLNFGGYWNWDPVENAVFVPWLTMVGAVHAMINYRKTIAAVLTSVSLALVTFILILYSTFLTRSGILGNASVHSFTDLGLSGQLLIYLLAFAVLSVLLFAMRYKNINGNDLKFTAFQSDFWIFLGITTLCLSAFQVLSSTSIPVYNALLKAVGYASNFALPADQIAHYSKFQIWFGIVIALLSGTGQFFYWNKIDKSNLTKYFYTPIVITLICAIATIYFVKIDQLPYIILCIACIYGFVANGAVAIKIIRQNPKLSGGAVAHLGIILMLIGILFSAGYSKIVSTNTSGLLYSKQFSTDMNRDNVLLWRHDPLTMGQYQAIYKGPCIVPEGYNLYIPKKLVRPTEDPYLWVMNKNYSQNEKIILKAGDTITYLFENTYFEIEFTKDNDKFTLYPRAQVNKEMGLLASPDIKKMGDKDLYAHVSSVPDESQEKEWSEPLQKTLALGDTFLINDYYSVFENIERINEVEGIKLQPADAAVKATIKVLGSYTDVVLEPIFVIHHQMIGRIPDYDEGLGIKAALMNIDPQNGKFTLSISTTQRDWVILKAMEKPLIDLLWGGALLVVIGFVIAIYHAASKRN
ncbi:MAG: cytochrome c biogenesis protein CcsA [Cytophagales bacterium]|nr:cytochrome c biogenesis protein CcsA [Cytophagales bacterium]